MSIVIIYTNSQSANVHYHSSLTLGTNSKLIDLALSFFHRTNVFYDSKFIDCTTLVNTPAMNEPIVVATQVYLHPGVNF